MAPLRKILILRFSSLGDIVMGTPMIRCLRKAYPHAQIDMIVRSDYLDLIRHNPHLDQCIGLSRNSGFSGLLSLLRQINRERYDLVFDAHRSLRTTLLMPFVAAEHKRYLSKQYFRRNLTLLFKLPLLKKYGRMIERYIDPLSDFGVQWDHEGPEMFVSPEVAQHAEQKFRIPKSASYIGLIPSAQWEGKRWPEEKFRQLAARIVDETKYSVIVFGGKNDTFCASICEGLPRSRAFNAQGKLNIAQAASIVQRCEFVIANDTGLMHIADALKIPSVVILGPTTPILGCTPHHPQSQIVQQSLWCQPCSKNGQAPCIRKRRYCLEDISPERVFQSAALLSQQLASQS